MTATLPAWIADKLQAPNYRLCGILSHVHDILYIGIKSSAWRSTKAQRLMPWMALWPLEEAPPAGAAVASMKPLRI